MTDTKLRELERKWNETHDVEDGLRYLKACQRAADLERSIEVSRSILKENLDVSEARAELCEHAPYAWTGFAYITRADCKVHVLEGARKFSINLNNASRHSTLRDIAFSGAVPQYTQLHIIEGSDGTSPLQATHHRIDCHAEHSTTPTDHDTFNTLCLENGVHTVRESTLAETWNGLGLELGYDIPLIFEARRRIISTAALEEGTIVRRERNKADRLLGFTGNIPFFYENKKLFFRHIYEERPQDWYDADSPDGTPDIPSVDFAEWIAPANLRYLRENRVSDPKDLLVMLQGTGKIGVEIPITMLDSLRRLHAAEQTENFTEE